MRLVLDASAAVQLCLAEDEFDLVAAHQLMAPMLLRSEVCSVLHEAAWRKRISRELAAAGRARLLQAPVTLHDDPELAAAAWAVADQLGWAKTYDAEYIALAQREAVALLTVDARLARGAGRLVRIVTPDEI